MLKKAANTLELLNVQKNALVEMVLYAYQNISET